MSEDSNRPVKAPKSRAKIIILVLSLLVLLLVYGAGFLALPVTILTKYHGKECDSVLRMNRIYASFYPQFARDASLVKYVQECEAYTLAVSNEENEKWDEAYDAFQTYGKNYPGGLYADQIHEHSANALMKIVENQVQQKNYEEALKNLDLVVTRYSDSSVSADALPLVLSTYSSWGSELRTAGNFDQAEHLFNDFKTWGQTNQKADLQTTAQSELAQTYLEWGESLEAQKQFEEALAKFDRATSVSTGSPFDTSKIKADQVKLYIDWGNHILEQGNFPVAIEKFQLAVSQSTGDASAGDALANGQIQWASSLSASEDFKGAIEHLNLAKETAVSDAIKKSVESAFDETYVTFSKSSGTQARVAMKDALKTVCEQHKTPDLPIFGLNNDVIHVGMYGVDDPLPDSVVAKTPGEMYYVACVTVDQRYVDHHYYSRYKKSSQPPGYKFISVRQYAIKLFWNIDLIKITDVEKLATNTFAGDPPPAFQPITDWDDTDENYFGKPPSVDVVAEWLQSVIK